MEEKERQIRVKAYQQIEREMKEQYGDCDRKDCILVAIFYCRLIDYLFKHHIKY